MEARIEITVEAPQRVARGAKNTYVITVKRLLAISDVELDAIIDRVELTAFGEGKTRMARGSLARLLGL